jgi:hypothetical protein
MQVRKRGSKMHQSFEQMKMVESMVEWAPILINKHSLKTIEPHKSGIISTNIPLVRESKRELLVSDM